MNLQKLAAYARRFEALFDQQDALKADIKDLELEARVNAEINVKALRKVLTAMRKKKLGGLRAEIEDVEIIADTVCAGAWNDSRLVVAHDPTAGEIA